MSQWKNDDSAANSVLWAVAQYNKTANSTNQSAFFGNVTADAYVTGITVGQFGVDATEAGVSNGAVREVVFTSRGSGYGANATLTVSGGLGFTTAATGNAQANSTGRISAINFTNNGIGYTSAPILTIAPPTAVTFNALTAVSNTNDTITLTSANSLFLAGDRVQYLVAAGNTAISPLSNASFYYISFSNTTVVKLAATSGGANLDLTASVSETGHSLTGETATAVAVLSGAKGSTHAGWVVRTLGTGGRAGRVQYETLVAMGSMTGDASDDTRIPDA
jgi:hypothetical protein